MADLYICNEEDTRHGRSVVLNGAERDHLLRQDLIQSCDYCGTFHPNFSRTNVWDLIEQALNEPIPAVVPKDVPPRAEKPWYFKLDISRR